MGQVARIGAVLALLALTGCGAVNDVFGFGGGRDDPRAEVGEDGRPPLIDQVVSLQVDPTPDGVIVSAVGLPSTQGFWDADLVPVASQDPSILVLDFYISPPILARPAGTQPSREVLAGAVFSTQDLTGIRTIAVQGRLNRRSVTRQ
ncbi:MAG: hypothetical protein AAF366_11480 [Pseudomonadota bacterium]